MKILLQPKMQNIKILLLLVLTAILTFALFKLVQNPLLDFGSDWTHTYRPAALALIQGKSPYEVDDLYTNPFYAAPWAVIPLIPFALLPEQLGNIGIFLLGLLAFIYIAYKLGATPLSLVIFLLSASVIGCLWWGNIEWMPLLAIVLPAPLGLIFAITKPQIGIGLIIYWFVHILKTKGILEVTKTFLPVTMLTLLSFWLYGFWPVRFQQALAINNNGSTHWNTSLWPQGIFIGVWLLYKAIQNNKPKMAIAASPFLSPYALPFTWVAILVGLIDAPLELFLVSLALWLPVFLR